MATSESVLPDLKDTFMSFDNARKYRIRGGQTLEGTVTLTGAKNAISKQLIASLLTDEPCVLSNVPRMTEIHVVLEMLREIGTLYRWLDEDTLEIQTPTITRSEVSQKYSGFNRIPILMLAPLIHRAGSVTVPTVGGCVIGERPLDFHMSGLRQMGADIRIEGQSYVADGRHLRGTNLTLPYPSVGATENLLIAATLARGTTVIHNAAVEPEIIDTILFLQKMGALITVDVDRRIIVEGVEKLHGARHRCIPDRIEAASFAVLAVITDGRITLKNARQEDLITFLNMLHKVGGGFSIEEEGMTFFRAAEKLRPVHLETDVHPGFMTDWQQPFSILLTQADGVSVIHETVYEKRFGYTAALRSMGADIELMTACLGHKNCRFLNRDHQHSCIIKGATPLKGGNIEIPDLRAGFAYLISALVAEGESEITGIRYIERGHAHLPEKIRALGGALTVVEGE